MSVSTTHLSLGARHEGVYLPVVHSPDTECDANHDSCEFCGLNTTTPVSVSAVICFNGRSSDKGKHAFRSGNQGFDIFKVVF